MKIPSDLPQLLALIAMLHRLGFALSISALLETAAKAVEQEVSDATNPVVTVLSYIGSSQCENVKKLLGVDYEQVQGSEEPDVENLTLVFISQNGSKSIYLREVVQVLPTFLGKNDTLKIFMHGFIDNPENTNFQSINEALQEEGDACILALDASSLIKWFYLRSSTYVQFIGERLGQALAELFQIGMPAENIHLIGHSLGAHIAAFAGKYYRNATGQLVGRLTGLDPAGPCFSNVDDDLRLNKTDAAFVDVIHTDGGVFGLTETLGHADFFPNGGSQQPGCFLETCSHSRAVTYFAESIRARDGFQAQQCNDYEEFSNGTCQGPVSLMGFACTYEARGRYYLQTNTTEPYAQGSEGLKYVNRDGVVKNITNIIGKILMG